MNRLIKLIGRVLQAQDKDAGKFGKIEYRLINNETDGGMYDYFSIDPDSGDIRTQKPLDTVPRSVLPIRLTVEARDNPQETQNFNVARTEVVVSNAIQTDPPFKIFMKYICLNMFIVYLTRLNQKLRFNCSHV